MAASVEIRTYEMRPKLSNCLSVSLNQHDDVRGCVDTVTSQRPKLETDAQQRTWKDRIKCNFFKRHETMSKKMSLNREIRTKKS